MEQHEKVLQERRESRSQDNDTEFKEAEAVLEETNEESKVNPLANASQAKPIEDEKPELLFVKLFGDMIR